MKNESPEIGSNGQAMNILTKDSFQALEFFPGADDHGHHDHGDNRLTKIYLVVLL